MTIDEWKAAMEKARDDRHRTKCAYIDSTRAVRALQVDECEALKAHAIACLECDRLDAQRPDEHWFNVKEKEAT